MLAPHPELVGQFLVDTLRTKAEAWTAATSADVFAGVPQALIDYADLFTDSMTALAGRTPNRSWRSCNN